MWRELGLATLAVSACSNDRRASAPAPIASHPRALAPRAQISSIAAADYVGPAACGACHADEYARWSQSLHRVMNAKAEDAGAIIGDFAGATVHYAGGDAHFTHDASGYAMTLARGATTTRYRVTRTIGRRGLQEYVGIEDGHTEEVRLPFGWWPRRGGWYPQPYYDPWLRSETDFNAYAPVREPWAERCPWCHSTYPFAQRIARASGPSALGHGMEQLFVAPAQGERLVVDQQITTGISCESCHLGGRDHAAGGAIHFVPQGATARDGVAIPAKPFAGERADATIVNAVCAQCHSGPSPRLPDQTATRNSSEALDLAASPCHGLKCTDCHDPHRADSRLGASEPRAIAACTHCHDSLAQPAAAAAHAGTGHAGVSCLDCHMPRMVMGIDRLVRTHRISSPTDPRVLAVAGPNACNLCHLDRSIEWTASSLARDYEVHLPVATWDKAYPPSLDTPVGEVWLASREPAFRLIAALSYAHSPFARAALPKLFDRLADPLAYLRTWTLFAVEDVLGRTIAPSEFDPRAAPAVRAKQLGALRHAHP